MNPIQVIGIDKLDSNELKIANKLANEYYVKFQRAIKNITSLIIQIKIYQKGGSQKRFAIHSRVTSPGHHFESTKAIDWDFARTMHKSLQDIEREIEHKLHSSDQLTKILKKKEY